uniref:Uncharacterized protein n=1 Tax=Setaria italica TaxID=4555 RepID=K3ZEU5_SETIT
MGPAFNATHPITAKQVEQLFEARILYDHREQRFKMREDLARIYCKACVAQISCAKDLILLSVPRGQFANYCNQSSGILSIAPNPPSPLQRVAMLFWPPNRHRTSVSGEASHPGRLISSVSVGNPFGYSMRLAEVNITSEKGSS